MGNFLPPYITKICLVVLFAISYFQIRSYMQPLSPLQVDLNPFWGPEERQEESDDVTIRAQQIYYAEETIDELKVKLNESLTLHYPLEGTLHEYGINSKSLIELINYWRYEYLPKWDERLQLINSVPHFITEVQGYGSEPTIILI